MTAGADVRIRLPARPDAVPAARAALEELVGRLPETVVEDARLVVSELVTNSVRHARLPADARLTLSVSLMPDRLRIEVVDDGRGFRVAGRVRPSAEQDHGWGLYLVEQLADRWGVDAGGPTRVWAEFDLREER